MTDGCIPVAEALHDFFIDRSATNDRGEAARGAEVGLAVRRRAVVDFEMHRSLLPGAMQAVCQIAARLYLL